MPLYEAPVYSLTAVVEETGLKAETLRAWERRYGLPRPQRTEGGHRLYSRRDIDVIRWLQARQREGLRIRSAVELWRRMEVMPLAVSAAETPSQEASDALAGLRQVWLAACMDFDEQGAEQVLAEAFALYSPEMVVLQVLRQGLAEMGDRWCAGAATVQQEHFASTLAVRRLDAMIAAAPAPLRAGRILAACPPGEEHAFALLLLTFLLRRRGWDVVYLGADVPIAQMEAVTQTVRPRLAVASAQRLPAAAALLEMAAFLAGHDVPLAYGGEVVNRQPSLRQRIPGYFLGPTLEGAPDRLEELLGRPLSIPPVEPAPAGYLESLGRFRSQQLNIEAQLWAEMQSLGAAHDHLVWTNREVADHIAAALALGDVDLLDSYLEWQRGVCVSGRMPVELSNQYLRAYYQAARLYLGEADVLVAWLAKRI